jgi:hypothetical protein
MSTDHRQAAQDHVDTLVTWLKGQLATGARDTVIGECEALIVAIRAFHMEGIRFRMFNVDRLLSTAEVSAEARAAFTAARRELEAAGFHTRSHQAPN